VADSEMEYRLKSNRFWLFVLVGVVMASAVVALLLGRVTVSYARIYKAGELTEVVNLSVVTEPYSIVLHDDLGLNVVEVEPGRVSISKSDCPDGICVRQGWISGGLVPIVCLPNRVIITLDGGDSDVDAIVG